MMSCVRGYCCSRSAAAPGIQLTLKASGASACCITSTRPGVSSAKWRSSSAIDCSAWSQLFSAITICSRRSRGPEPLRIDLNSAALTVRTATPTPISANAVASPTGSYSTTDAPLASLPSLRSNTSTTSSFLASTVPSAERSAAVSVYCPAAALCSSTVTDFCAVP